MNKLKVKEVFEKLLEDYKIALVYSYGECCLDDEAQTIEIDNRIKEYITEFNNALE